MNEILIFTDGAAKGNPGPGGFGAVLSYKDTVVEIGGGKDRTTNNEMELKAVVEALKIVASEGASAVIYTDSKYVEQGATAWIFNWVKNNWQTKAETDVLNKELWMELHPLLQNVAITWHKVSGHVDMIGNERADRIASGFAEQKHMDLYNGPKSEYGYDIDDTSYDKAKEAKRKEARKRQGQKAHSYVSMVDGVVQTHTSWGDCEKRVKGKKGVRFKKAISAAEEKEIIADFSK